jgi:hypothetical protein
MRSVTLIGLVVVLLIVGILVVKNMGGGSLDEEAQTEAKKVIRKAEDTSDRVAEKVKRIQDRVNQAD